MENKKQPTMAGAVLGGIIVGIVLGAIIFSGSKKEVKVPVTSAEVMVLKETDDQLIERLSDGIFLASKTFEAVSKGDTSELNYVQAESLTISRDVEQLVKQRKAILKEMGY